MAISSVSGHVAWRDWRLLLINDMLRTLSVFCPKTTESKLTLHEGQKRVNRQRYCVDLSHSTTARPNLLHAN